MPVPHELRPIIESHQDLRAVLWVNGENTGATISISGESLTLTGLQPELPPSLHVWRGGAEYWDGQAWQTEKDAGAQIYLLFHPRLALEKGDRFERPADNVWTFHYSARTLLPESLIAELSAELERRAEIEVEGAHLVYFKTNGIEPDPEEVELRFGESRP